MYGVPEGYPDTSEMLSPCSSQFSESYPVALSDTRTPHTCKYKDEILQQTSSPSPTPLAVGPRLADRRSQDAQKPPGRRNHPDGLRVFLSG